MALEPQYVTPAPNDDVTLYKGPLTFIQGEDVVRGSGRVFVRWLPIPDIAFSVVAEDDQGHMAVFRQRIRPGPGTLTIGDLVAGTDCYVVRAPHEVRDGIGTAKVEGRCGPIVFGDGDQVSSVTFHVVNFPPYRGSTISARRSGNNATWGGRIQSAIGDWVITLDSCVWNDDLGKATRDAHGYAITHVGSVARADGGGFEAVQTEAVLDLLFHVLAFCRGGWSPPVLLAGAASSGEIVWRNWEMPKCHPYRPKFTWWPRDHPSALATVLSNAESSWHDAAKRHALTIAWNFYVEATASLSNETALLLSQAGIALLRARHGFGGRPAGGNTARFLKDRNIPLDVPRSLPKLRGYAAARSQDGPTSVAEIRNAIAHPDVPASFFSGEWPSTDARRLSTWYLELLLLSELGYEGPYENQLNDHRWSNETERVPWAEDTPGELPQNVGNSQS
jgi:hypothetical protein